MERRLALAELLCEAAELEHLLVCTYLFAAFSLKREDWEGGVTLEQLALIRSWEADLLLIARQEMEHLTLVCDLLTAIGEAPYLRRPNFPVSGTHYPLKINVKLECFGARALQRFIEFEMPQILTKFDKELVAGIDVDHAPRATIGRLYAEIEDLFIELAGPDLFVGPPAAQLTTGSGPRGLTLAAGPTYQVTLQSVTDEKSAKAAIHQIIEEGEGTRGHEQNSHFARLCRMYKQLEAEQKDAGFSPARPVISEKIGVTGAVDAPQQRPLEGIGLELVELFDLAYETLILMLIRFFAHSHERLAEVNALQSAAFFPMMTAVIRPLGEIITQLPRFPGSDVRASPRFGFDRELSLLPHAYSADTTICFHLELLASKAAALAGRGKVTGTVTGTGLEDAGPDGAQPRDLQPRLQLISENLARMASDFETRVRRQQ